MSANSICGAQKAWRVKSSPKSHPSHSDGPCTHLAELFERWKAVEIHQATAIERERLEILEAVEAFDFGALCIVQNELQHVLSLPVLDL